MSTITYKIIKHDGGWAYEANGTYSQGRWHNEVDSGTDRPKPE